MTLQKDVRAKLTPSFWTLNVTQFLSAMNDNAFRFLLGLALVGHFSDPAKGQQEWPIYVAGFIFALPFILFSSAAGILADRFSKSRLIVIINAVAVGAMLLAIPAFLSNNAVLLYLVLFLMLTHSAFFTPCKLGILPEIVPRERISQANGLMEMFVNLAIILGSILGPWLYGRFGEPESVAYASTASCWRGAALCAGVSVARVCVVPPDPAHGALRNRGETGQCAFLGRCAAQPAQVPLAPVPVPDGACHRVFPVPGGVCPVQHFVVWR
jgi:MFS family permease